MPAERNRSRPLATARKNPKGLSSIMRLTKPTNPPPGIWPTFGLKSNASGAQPFPSSGNGAEKSQRDFINQPRASAAGAPGGMLKNNFYPAGVSCVLTCADAARSWFKDLWDADLRQREKISY